MAVAPTLSFWRLAKTVLRGYRDRADLALDAGINLGGVVRLPVPGLHAYLVSGPEAVHRVMIQNAANYTKSPDYQVLAALLGQGLLTSDDATWESDRKRVQPLFAQKLVHAYVPRIIRCVRELAQTWATQTGPVQMEREMARLALRIIGYWILDLDVTPHAERISAILDEGQIRVVKRGLAIVDLAKVIATPPERRFRHRLAELHTIMDGLLDTYLAARAPERVDFITTLQAAGKTRAQIREHMITVFLAGHETTAVAMTWFFTCLCREPEIQARIAGEIDAAFGDAGLREEHIPDLAYTSQALQESMRLFPPIGFMGRQAKAPDVVDGIPIPKGAMLALCPYATHRLPQVWPEPERFVPERFTKERRAEIPSGAYYPFSLGPRRCVGMYFALLEMQCIAAVLTQRFAFTLSDRVRDLRPVPLVSMRPNQPVWIWARPRAAGNVP